MNTLVIDKASLEATKNDDSRTLPEDLNISKERADILHDEVDAILSGKNPVAQVEGEDGRMSIPLAMEAIEQVCENQNEFALMMFSFGRAIGEQQANPFAALMGGGLGALLGGEQQEG